MQLGGEQTVSEAISTTAGADKWHTDALNNIRSLEKQVAVNEQEINALVKTEADNEVMDIQELLDEEGNVFCKYFPLSRSESSLTVAASTINGKVLNNASTVCPDGSGPFERFLDSVSRMIVPEGGNTTKKLPQPVQETTTSPSVHVIGLLDDAENVAQKTDRPPERVVEGGGCFKVLSDPKTKNEDWVQEVSSDSVMDARLRQEMLRYNMEEIGALVAEINLEENGDYYGYEGSDDEDDEDELEDEYGRTIQAVVPESYRKEMEELQRKIKERSEQSKVQDRLEQENAKPKKKGVRFAEELDVSAAPDTLDELTLVPDKDDALPFLMELIAREEIKNIGPKPVSPKPVPAEVAQVLEMAKKSSLFKQPVSAEPKTGESAKPEHIAPTTTVKQEIIERSSNTTKAPTIATSAAAITMPATQPKKVSRFKTVRAAVGITEDETEPISEPSVNLIERERIIVNKIVERTAQIPNIKAPNESDPHFHRQEITTQFHKLRTRMIQKQGGFVENEEEQRIVPLDESGEKIKVSRFKAARLKSFGEMPPLV